MAAAFDYLTSVTSTEAVAALFAALLWTDIATDQLLHLLHYASCRELLLSIAGMLAISYWLHVSLLLLLGLSLAAVQTWCLWQAALRVENIRGHRAGAHGYSGGIAEMQEFDCLTGQQ